MMRRFKCRETQALFEGNSKGSAFHGSPISRALRFAGRWASSHSGWPRKAKEIGVPQRRIGESVAGKRSITADTAARLGAD